jgi:hypothetical protein
LILPEVSIDACDCRGMIIALVEPIERQRVCAFRLEKSKGCTTR